MDLNGSAVICSKCQLVATPKIIQGFLQSKEQHLATYQCDVVIWEWFSIQNICHKYFKNTAVNYALIPFYWSFEQLLVYVVASA